MKIADFHDWHYPFKDDSPYMTQLGVLGAELPSVRLRGRCAPKIMQMCRYTFSYQAVQKTTFNSLLLRGYKRLKFSENFWKMHIFDNLIVLKGFKMAEILNF